MKVLLVGISTRAMAQSAVAAGYEVISLDFFGDSDQPGKAEVHSLVRDLGQPAELSALARSAVTFIARVDRVVVESGLENEPALLELCLPLKRWGNSTEAVHGARDMDQLRNALRGTGMRLPEVIQPGEPLPSEGHYLVKNHAYSGGIGVREWDGHTPPRGREVLQDFIPGDLASACFAADGRQVRLLGLTRQYAGEPGLRAPSFAWCGNVVPWGGLELVRMVQETIEALTKSFGLVGLNGIDFIVQNGIPYLLEVNPRPPASFELFERLLGVNAFQLHIQACDKQLPDSLPSMPTGLAWGKGIMYAKEDLLIGDTLSWMEQDIADIPHSGEQIKAGAPVCTIFAKGRDVGDCWAAVLARASGWPFEDSQ